MTDILGLSVSSTRGKDFRMVGEVPLFRLVMHNTFGRAVTVSLLGNPNEYQDNGAMRMTVLLVPNRTGKHDYLSAVAKACRHGLAQTSCYGER